MALPSSSETDDAALHTLGFLTRKGFLTHELRLVELDKHAEARLDGGYFLGKLVAIEGDLPRSGECRGIRTAGLHTCLHQFIPYLTGEVMAGIDLETIFTSVSGTAYDHILAIEDAKH